MKRTITPKRAMYAALAAIGVTAGAAGIAAATTGTVPFKDNPAAVGSEKGAEKDEAPLKTSVKDPQGDTEAEESDAAEAARLAKLAKISPDQAKAAAIAAKQGTATKVELESDDGYVVYEVDITAADGSYEVKVDPGNGKVVEIEKEDHDEGHDDHESGKEAPESTEKAQPGTPGTDATQPAGSPGN